MSRIVRRTDVGIETLTGRRRSVRVCGYGLRLRGSAAATCMPRARWCPCRTASTRRPSPSSSPSRWRCTPSAGRPRRTARCDRGGTIGLLCAAALADRGVAVDLLARHPAQRAAADALGAGGAATGRYGLVIDAAGSVSSREQAVRSAERGGSVVLVALPWEPVVLPPAPVIEEVAVRPAVYYSRAEFEDAARLLARHPELPGLLVTHRFGLDDAADAFTVAGNRAAGAIKVHLLP